MRSVLSHGIAVTLGVFLGVAATSVILGDRDASISGAPVGGQDASLEEPSESSDVGAAPAGGRRRSAADASVERELPVADDRGEDTAPWVVDGDAPEPAEGEGAATDDAAVEEPPPPLGELLARLDGCLRRPERGGATEVAGLLREHHPDYEAPPGRVYDLLQSGHPDLASAAQVLIESWGANMVRAALTQEVRMLPADPSPTRVAFLEALLWRRASLDDEPIGRELDQLLRHRSSRVRGMGVELLSGLDEGQFDPSLLQRPLEDPSPLVRAIALGTASDWLDMRVDGVFPEAYRAAAEASIADPDGEVREAGAWLIASMGPEGADLALEVLRVGAPESDLRHGLATSVAMSPHAHALLAGDPPETHVDAVLSVLADWSEDDEDPARSETERRRLVELLPRVLPHIEDRDSLQWLFGAAMSLGARSFVIEVLHDGTATFEARAAAFSSLVAFEAPATELAPAFERFLSDYGDAPSNRRRVLEILRENVWINLDENAPLRAIVVRLSKSDPSPWVRDVAIEFLAEGYPEDE